MNENTVKFPSGEVWTFSAPDPVYLADGSVDTTKPAPVWGLSAYKAAPGDTRAAPAIGTAPEAMPAPFQVTK